MSFLTPQEALELIQSGHTFLLRRKQITPHFTWGEAFHRVMDDRLIEADIHTLNNLFALFNRMEAVRAWLGGRRITITSAWRDKRKNAAVGGVSNSRHLTGEACDFVVQGLSNRQVQRILDSNWYGGLGYGSTFTHLDIRPQYVRFGYG